MTDLRQGEISSKEVHRILRVYTAREAAVVGTRKNDATNPGNQTLERECHDRLAHILHRRFERPLATCRVLDVGCGYGSLLGWLNHQGVPAENLVGVDLLPSRIAIARQAFPGFTFVEGNAERLDFPDSAFDLVSVGTVFSSILGRRMAENVARDIHRVLAPGGAVVWYDMRYPNPWNRNLRAMTRSRIQALFPGFKLDLESVTLLPPLARRLGRFTASLYPLLARARFLRTHYVGLLRPARTADVAVKPNKHRSRPDGRCSARTLSCAG